MDKNLQNFLLIFFITHAYASGLNQSDTDVISFTHPLYYGLVQEKEVSSMVKSDVMMGMWLTEATQDVQYEIDGATRGFKASKIVFGNFVFLNLRTTSVNKGQDVRVRAVSRAFNQETFCTVRVSVVDLNDFQPLFPPQPYSISINEDTKVGSVITHVKAIDSDRSFENKRFYYSLAEFTSDYFAVHPTTGAVILTAPLNSENQASHSVIIQATDRKAALAGTAKPKTTTLTVSVNTVNLHSPEIIVREPLSFDSTLTESFSQHQRLYAILQVQDPDSGANGETTMPMVIDCDIPGLFTVEKRAKNEYHLLFTTAPPPLNGIVNVTLEVSDHGNPPRTSRKTIGISLFNRKSLVPVFLKESYTMVVSEISPISTQVGFVLAQVTGSDNSDNVRYSITSGNNDAKFKIDPKTSLITTIRKFNRNKKQKYQLIVTAVNIDSVDYSQPRNTTTVTILIEDANNHDPIFAKDFYSSSIKENAPVGTVVAQVQANDSDSGINGTVIYSLVDVFTLPFAIDSFNGTIYTTDLLDSDTLTRNTFELRVRASDSGLPFNRKSECVVAVRIINTNDNPPIFNEVDCDLTIPSSTRKGTKILQLNSIDIDLNPVTCLLLSGGDGWFKMEPQTCELRLAADLVNMEPGRVFTLLVTASDGKFTSEPVNVNVSVENGVNKIVKSCRDTGAIRRFEDSISNLQLTSSQSGEKTTVNKSNRTSQLPNKYKPVLVPNSSILVVNVSESAKLNSVVARVRAIDRDTGYNGKLWFTITAGNVDSCFIINTQTGFIYLARALDRERMPSYHLVIKVSDFGTPSRSTTLRLKFIVTDVNDNSPTFSQSSYFFELPENVTVGYRIQNRIQATDIDEGNNARVHYSLAPHSYGYNSFSIHPITGFISVTKKLDREEVSQFNLTVVASDSAPLHPRKSSASVAIRLLDVNDNPPQFYQSVYKIRISEDLPKHVVLFWLQAHDKDEGENSAIRYTLTDGVTNKNDGRTRFDVDDRTGAIRLLAPLDARVQSRYNITARARDSKKLYSTCYIEVEVLPVNRNLHAPYFSDRYIRIEVAEDAVVGTKVGVMSATDEDRTEPERIIAYRIDDGTGLGVFAIDENTGIITSLKTLDRETEQYYWLTVVAEDRASVPLSGHVFVLVEVTDVNDNAPQALEPIYFASIEENSPRGSVVTQVKSVDHDSGSGANITYSMDVNNYFRINTSTGVISTTVPKRRLDRETINPNQLSLKVSISNGGSPSLSSSVPVVVNVTDINDNPPVFYESQKTRYFLPERNRTKTPTPIARVVALDKDGGRNANIDYTLANNRKFTINSKTGVISTRKSFKAGQKSVLKVSAFDLANDQKQTKIRLDIDWLPVPKRSRQAPIFTDDDNDIQQGCYFEHVEPGYVKDETFVDRSVRLLQAEDVDSERLWFRIAGGNDDSMFDINNDNVLFVAGEPDAEIKDSYNLTLEVTDGFNKAIKQINVSICDINDHRPMFNETLFGTSIDENLAPNSRVVQLSVTDGDRCEKNRNFIFKISGSVDPASAAKFRITSDGTIYTTVRLNREVQRQHVLFVEVDDQGVPGSLQDFTQVVISVVDRNEHAPQFTSSSYTAQLFLDLGDPTIGVDETTERVVLRVRATDQDTGENARIFYSILSGTNERFWKINPSTGEISPTKKLLSADARSASTSSLVVQATDGGRPSLSSTCHVTINIKTPRTAVPQFETDDLSVDIRESASVGSFVAMVTATASSTITYSLATSNNGQQFSINPYSGVISLAANLDRERQARYQLHITCVSTEGGSAEASVEVNVLDVNDNRPRFNSSSYIGFVSESSGSSASGSVTDVKNHPLVVSAFDLDFGTNAQITYEILDPSSEIARRFSIDSNTGALRTKPGVDLFDYESVTEYHLKVRCHDMGSPRLLSENSASVTIHVRDANDTIPVFTKPRYNFELLLPTADGMVISKKAKATYSVTKKRPSFLTYFISSGNSAFPFKIDPNSGVLSVNNASSLSAGNTYNLRLRVSDGKRSASATALISVSNMSETEKLLFTKDVYDVQVQENSTEVLNLVAPRVVGSQLEDNLRFKILNPNPGFRIEPTSGLIQTTGLPVDREEKSILELLVEAINIDARSESSENILPRGRCKVKVHVSDVNDNPPRFLKSLYHAIVQIDAEPLAVVKQVRAVDADVGKNAMVRYTLTGSNSTWFDVDSDDGIITLRRSPDTGDGGNKRFNVTVVAHDLGTPSLSNSVVMIVSVVNRATPVFTQTFYDHIFVSEDAQAHIVVSDAVKASSPDGSDVVYSIEDGDPEQQFDVDFNSGTITTRRSLDYEIQSRYRLRVRARDSQSRAYADAEVEIRISDVNDNAPVFALNVYQEKLSETASVGSTVVQVQASDKDSLNNGKLSYQIVDDLSSDGGYFHIDRDTGVVWTARELDFEVKSILSFVVRASDHGAPMQHTDVNVVLVVDDVNDNPPVFEKTAYSYEVSSQAEPGRFIGIVSAWDPDSIDEARLVYSIPSSASRFLAVNSSSGLLTLVKKTNSPIVTNVTVTDGVFSSTVQLSVTFTSHDAAPIPVEFKKSLYKFSVSENQSPGSKVGRVSASGSQELTYQIESDSNFSDMFRIDASSGRLQTAHEIDREAIHYQSNRNDKATVIEFQVVAIDENGSVGKCRVRVKILDANDNAPMFTQSNYKAVVVPSNSDKDSVVNVTAYDLDAGDNGRITYTLHEASVNVKKHFLLDYATGEITVRGSYLPFSKVDVLNFFVRATDNNEADPKSNIVPVTLYLTTDQQSLPTFSPSPVFATLSENTEVGSEVATVQASTANNRKVVYELAEAYVGIESDEGSPDGGRNASYIGPDPQFRIDSRTGRIVTVSVLDRESVSTHVIDVIAYVKTTPKLMTSTQVFVTVTDVNDNKPLFTASVYHASIVENSLSQSKVTTVEARDPDEGQFGEILYSLELPTGVESPFIIDSRSGVLSTSARLDRENQSRYELTVKATDGGELATHSSTSSVIINIVDVNDSPPTFSKPAYQASISESASPGQRFPDLMRITDPDRNGLSSVRLYIISGDSDQRFEVIWSEPILNNNAAMVGLQVVRELDREETANYTLTLLATDGLHNSTAQLLIKVEDVNDNSPQCEQLSYYASVSERVSLTSPIIRLQASDADVGENGKVRFDLTGEGSLDFRIDSQTGELFAVKELDRESTSHYTLISTASDGGGNTCVSQVLISVEDTNDNIPMFEESSLRAATKENTAVNSFIHRVTAVDRDRGVNGTLAFALIDDINGQFYVEPKTGIVVLKKPLDRETVPSYKLQVKVLDHGNEEQLSSTSVLDLKVLDINDNPPKFDREQYEVVVPENATLGLVVAEVSAESLDIGANAEIYYEITRGNERGKFEINQTSGQVILVSGLDYESDQSYVLRISAADQSDAPLTSDCTLRVNVSDVNDNAPQFALPSYKITLGEDAPIGHVVTSVSASDRDSGPAGQVSYRLQETDNTPFEIDSVSGTLQLIAPGLDYEKQNFYRVPVVSFDAGSPVLRNQVFVEIIVTDVNDNRPRFDVRSPLGEQNSDVTCLLDGANCTVYVHESSEEPVVKGIAFINATDADSRKNGAPFKFEIMEGNSEEMFYLNEDNILKSRRPFELNHEALNDAAVKRKTYTLRISATDSGKPLSLSARPDLTLSVIVLKKNLYAPEITLLHVEIATADGQFSGTEITTKLHATDRDAFDQNRIRFALANSEDFEQFVIDPMNGALSTQWPLPVGQRNITVRVSDGVHSSFSNVFITVNQISQRALENSVSIAFSGVESLEKYLDLYHVIFVRKLENALPNNFDSKRDLVIMSLQKRKRNVELLFGIRMPPDTINRRFYSSKSLRGFLETSRGLLMEEGTGLQVQWIDGIACTDGKCNGSCRQLPTLQQSVNTDSKQSIPVTTNDLSWVTPTFTRRKTCVCPVGTIGKRCESICSHKNNPCSKNRVCTLDIEESLGYRCEKPSPTKSVMAFSGHAYARYGIDNAVKSGQFRVSMRLRTFQSNATVFHADGPSQHFARLETVGGLLRYTFDCGSGPQEMMQTLAPVEDGRWHKVNIESRHDRESNSWNFKLTIDDSYIASAKAFGGEPKISLSQITFGGIPLQHRGKRSARAAHDKRHAALNQVVKHGFRGCMRSVNLNDSPLTMQTKSGSLVNSKLNVKDKCDTSFIDMGACKDSPCLNGGLCLPLSDGSHECECPRTYNGAQCEFFDPCATLSCNNQGYCISDGHKLQCRCYENFSGDHCENAICPGVGSCHNGGVCINDSNGLSSCLCEPEWFGSNCNKNLKECITQCGSENYCEIVNDKYVCNCSTTDPNCKAGPRTTDPPSPFPWVFIVFPLLGIMLLTLVIIISCCCVKRKRRKEEDSDDFTAEPFIPSRLPPVPERPADYQRSSRDSFNFDPQKMEDQDRNIPVMYVQPQLSPVSPNMSALSDSDSIRKPSPSWPEYDSAAYCDKSVQSSVRKLSNSKENSSQSNVEQQSFHWDDGDLKTESMLPHAPSRNQYLRNDPAYPPSSPCSYNSSSTYVSRRSQRSHKTSALSGHYSSGRRRAEKQLIQMIKMNENIRENEEGMELQVREILSQALRDQNTRHCDSSNNSLKSFPSGHQSAFQRFSKTNSPHPSSSYCATYTPETSDLSDNESNPYQVQQPLLGLASSRTGYPDKRFKSIPPDGSHLDFPSPPSDDQLQDFHGDEEDSESLHAAQLPPASSNKSYSSLLNTSFQVEMPTPTAARMQPFHPGQYLVDHAYNMSEMSLATDPASGSSYAVNGPHFDPRVSRRNPMGSYETPRPPRRRDSERLTISSLSDDDESDSVPQQNLPRQNKRGGRYPSHPKNKTKRPHKPNPGLPYKHSRP